MSVSREPHEFLAELHAQPDEALCVQVIDGVAEATPEFTTDSCVQWIRELGSFLAEWNGFDSLPESENSGWEAYEALLNLCRACMGRLGELGQSGRIRTTDIGEMVHRGAMEWEMFDVPRKCLLELYCDWIGKGVTPGVLQYRKQLREKCILADRLALLDMLFACEHDESKEWMALIVELALDALRESVRASPESVRGLIARTRRLLEAESAGGESGVHADLDFFESWLRRVGTTTVVGEVPAEVHRLIHELPTRLNVKLLPSAINDLEGTAEPMSGGREALLGVLRALVWVAQPERSARLQDVCNEAAPFLRQYERDLWACDEVVETRCASLCHAIEAQARYYLSRQLPNVEDRSLVSSLTLGEMSRLVGEHLSPKDREKGLDRFAVKFSGKGARRKELAMRLCQAGRIRNMLHHSTASLYESHAEQLDAHVFTYRLFSRIACCSVTVAS